MHSGKHDIEADDCLKVSSLNGFAVSWADVNLNGFAVSGFKFLWLRRLKVSGLAGEKANSLTVPQSNGLAVLLSHSLMVLRTAGLVFRWTGLPQPFQPNIIKLFASFHSI